jgi:hypothetical protein
MLKNALAGNCYGCAAAITYGIGAIWEMAKNKAAGDGGLGKQFNPSAQLSGGHRQAQGPAAL